jgi:C4-dicarboxylate transporter, DctM subunit
MRPAIATKVPGLPLKERVKGIFGLFPVLVIGGLVLVPILTGTATPTEASGIGVVGVFLLILARKRTRKVLTLKLIIECVTTASRMTGVLLLVLVGASILTYTWNLLGVPQTVSRWVAALEVNRVWILVSIYAVYFVLGCLMDGLSIMLLTIPVFKPIILHLGYDPIWFGVMVGATIGWGQITPPVGASLFTLKAVFPQHPFETIVRGSMPLLIAQLLCAALLTIFPEITLWLPNLIYGPMR